MYIPVQQYLPAHNKKIEINLRKTNHRVQYLQTASSVRTADKFGNVLQQSVNESSRAVIKLFLKPEIQLWRRVD